MFQHKIVIKGTPSDLDGIYERLSFNQDQGRLVKYSDPNDLHLSPHVLNALGGKPLAIGTTRLEIEFNGSVDKLKGSILQRFPKVNIA